MKAIIIDDEIAAVENLTGSLNTLFPEVEIVGEAYSLKTGVDLLKEKKTDIVFLDIDLRDGSGFSLLDELNTIDFEVVFVTAYNDYAIRAFQVNALDYILKPLSDEDLARAVHKALKNRLKSRPSSLEIVLREIRQDRKQKRFAVKEDGGFRYLNVTDVLRCQSDKNYTDIHLLNGERIVSCRTLKEHDQILSEFGFYRIHQSHLVQLKCVNKIIRDDGCFVELNNGKVLPVSRRKKEGLIEKMRELEI